MAVGHLKQAIPLLSRCSNYGSKPASLKPRWDHSRRFPAPFCSLQPPRTDPNSKHKQLLTMGAGASQSAAAKPQQITVEFDVSLALWHTATHTHSCWALCFHHRALSAVCAVPVTGQCQDPCRRGHQDFRGGWQGHHDHLQQRGQFLQSEAAGAAAEVTTEIAHL